jgi:hypothetical protein
VKLTLNGTWGKVEITYFKRNLGKVEVTYFKRNLGKLEM